MNRPLWHQFEFWATVGVIVVLMSGHYLINPHNHFWHDLFRRLSYVPIIIAGFRYGLKGGIGTAGIIALLFLPHVFLTRRTLIGQAREAVFEIPLYLVVGVVTGVLSDRQRSAEEKLLQADRLKTMGTVAAGIAHEVKNPLTAIRSSVQILSGRLSDNDSELAALALSEIDRLNRLIEEFLQYARPAPLQLQSIEVREILDSALKFLEPLIVDKKVRIEKSYPEKGERVSADPNQLRQVFLNLILNAVQAVEPGGVIKVGVERKGKMVQVFIKDDGPGIPKSKIALVFEPFWSTKPQGTGLGLAIAQRIVKEHGGKLELESELGKGTTALISLKAE